MEVPFNLGPSISMSFVAGISSSDTAIGMTPHAHPLGHESTLGSLDAASHARGDPSQRQFQA